MANLKSTLNVTCSNPDLVIENNFDGALDQTGTLEKQLVYTSDTPNVADAVLTNKYTTILDLDGNLWFHGDYSHVVGDVTQTRVYDTPTIKFTNIKKLCGNLWFINDNDELYLMLDPENPVKWADNVQEFFAYYKANLDINTNRFWYLTKDGDLYGKGNNDNGQQGSGGTATVQEFTLRGQNVKKFKNTYATTWYLTNDGKLYGCGDGYYGQQGDGNLTDHIVTRFTQRATNVVDFDCAHNIYNGTCWYIDSAGDLYGCGYGGYGNQGNGLDYKQVDTAKTCVSRFTKRAYNVAKVVATTENTYYITTGGYLYACGWQYDGKTFTGRNTNYITTFTGIQSNVKDVYCSDYNAVYITYSGDLYIAGSDYSGAISGSYGDSTTYKGKYLISSDADRVASMTSYVVYINKSNKVVTGGRNQSFAMKQYTSESSGEYQDVTPEVYNWLDNGKAFNLSDYNITVIGTPNKWDSLNLTFKTVSADLNTKRLIACNNENVTVTCTNEETMPEIGTINYAWTAALSTSNIKQVEIHRNTMCYIDCYNDLYFIGSFPYGSAGVGTSETIVYNNAVKKASNVRKVGIGVHRNNVFYITNDDELFVAGQNTYGQLGTGNTTNVTTFTKIADNVKDASLSSHLLYVTNEDKMYGCGHNYQGQLSLGDFSTSTVLEPIFIADNVKSVYCGYTCSWYIDNNLDLYGCGNNNSGMQGTGIASDTSAVATFTKRAENVVKVDCSSATTHYLNTSNELWGAGYKKNNYLLDGTVSADAANAYSFILCRSNIKDFYTQGDTKYYVTTTGYLYAVGTNSYGGYGDTTSTSITAETGKYGTRVASNVDKVGYSYYIDNEGYLYLCGLNGYNQISHLLPQQQTYSMRATTLPTSQVPWTCVTQEELCLVDENNNRVNLEQQGIEIEGDLQVGDIITLKVATNSAVALAQGNRVGFRFMTSAQYEQLFAENAIYGNLIYCLTDTQVLMLEGNPYTIKPQFVEEYPENPAQGVLYITANQGVATWNGKNWNTILPEAVTVLDANTADENLLTAKAIRDFIDPLLNDGLVKDVTYDSAINCFTVEHLNGEIKELPLRNIVSAITYENGNLTFNKLGTDADVIVLPEENHLIDANYEHGILNLFLNDGTKVSVDLADLIDIYVGNETSSVDVKIENKEISANIKASAQNTRLVVNVDGIYVPADLVQTAGSTNSIDLSLENKELTGTVKLSSAQGNALQIKEDGLYTDRVDIDSYYNKENMDIALDAEKDQAEFDMEMELKVNPGVTHERHEVYNIEEVKITKAWQQMQ